jgi:iron complex outermembrane receptor protein
VNTVLTDNLNLHVGLSWFDSEARNVQKFCYNGEIITGDANVCEGVSIPWAPEWTAFAVLNANFPMGDGELFGSLAWSWEDDYRGDWPDPSVIYVENVFDGVWYDGNYANDDPDPIIIYAEHTFGPSRPRTMGVRFSYNWGG